MSKYTTGEMAKLCNVSVRTVQFYDTKGLLHPSELTEGGRRLYNDDDLSKMKLICTLKAIGLSLDSIKGIIKDESSGKVLSLLLEEQLKQLGDEIGDRQRQIDAIKLIQKNLGSMDIIPVNSINDIEHMMKNKKGLKKVYGTLLGFGLLMDALQIVTVVWWIIKGNWIPFAVAMPFTIFIGILLVRMYHRNTLYICAECNHTFRPKIMEFTFAAHTLKTRKLTCSNCRHKGYCVETYAYN